MHLLYLDDSGSVGNSSDKHIVLAGFSVFERSPHWLGEEMDKLAAQVWPEDPLGLEFRGSDILGGKRQWRGIQKDERRRVYSEALSGLARTRSVRLFAAAIYKSAVAPEDPMEIAFEQIVNRFDRMLGRLHKARDTQRGLLVLDKSSYETSLQRLATDFRRDGHRWGRLHNLVEVPLFVDSQATRMVQYADLVAHAVRRFYEGGDDTFFSLVRGAFDAAGGVTHGLIHFVPDGERCDCPACWQKPVTRKRRPER